MCKSLSPAMMGKMRKWIVEMHQAGKQNSIKFADGGFFYVLYHFLKLLDLPRKVYILFKRNMLYTPYRSHTSV